MKDKTHSVRIKTKKPLKKFLDIERQLASYKNGFFNEEVKLPLD
jgi:hypothetical protein